MELFEVILTVDDMEAQKRFYRDVLGLEVERDGEYWTTFHTGACTLALHGGGRGDGDGARIVFKVGDVVAERTRLLAAGVELGEVRSPVEGVLVLDGRDPEGNPFHLEERT
jgi:catechol 2,3-dioxygenase-like lactoylglutathione lyase family enzyme